MALTDRLTKKPIATQYAIRNTQYAVPALLAVGGLLLRLVGLTRQSLWTDELYAVGAARQPLAVLFNPALHLHHPPGYRLLLHTWLGVSLEEAWLRLLPALAGTLLIPVVWALGRALWPRRPVVGDLAALLVASAPFLLHYSQDVTTYSWTALWVSLSMLLLVRAWRDDRPWLWAAWAVSCAVALYSHYFSLFPLLIEGAAVLVAGVLVPILGARSAPLPQTTIKEKIKTDKNLFHKFLSVFNFTVLPLERRLAPAGLAILGAALLFAPWVTVLLSRRGEVQNSFQFPLTVDRQPLGWLPVLLAGYARPEFWTARQGQVVAWGALGALAAWGLWRLGRARSAGWAVGGALLVAGWGLAATAGPYGFLRLTTPPDGVTPVRFAALAAPALLLGLAALIATLPRPVRLGALLAWLALAGVQWQAEVTGPPKQDWRGMLGTVAAQARPGDVFLAFPAFHAGAGAAYYPVPLPVQGGWFVPLGDDPVGAAYWFPPGWFWRGFLNIQATRSADWAGEIGPRVAGAGRVWYLAGDGVDGTYKPSPVAEQAITAAGYQPAEEWRASPLVLRLYVRAPP